MNGKNILIYVIIFAVALTTLFPYTAANAFNLNEALKNNDFYARSTLNIYTVVGDIFTSLAKIFNISQGENEKKTVDTLNLSKNKEKEIIGFYAEWWDTDSASFRSLSQNIDTVKTIAPFWATMQADGTISDRGGNDHASIVKFAHQNNISVLLLVNNAKQTEQGKEKDPPIHYVLSNPALRARAIENIEKFIKKYELDGVNIDFELVPAKDRDNLTEFMRELSEKMKSQGYIVSIDVFPKTNESIEVSLVYDYSKLAEYADKIIIMTYDNHGKWSKAGPVADIRWVENSLKYALQFIPQNKLYLGIAAYGYDWSSNNVEHHEYAQIMNLSKRFKASIKWDESSKSPYFKYSDASGVKHDVWFENAASISYKLELVNKYDIAGIAMWKLGGEDPLYWQLFKDNFVKR